MGCWNPRCRRVAPVVLPRGHPERSSSDRQEQTRFKSCQACRCAHYCSRACQKADWPRHKNNCTDVGRAFSVDRRREIHEGQKVHTSFGLATSYEFSCGRTSSTRSTARTTRARPTRQCALCAVHAAPTPEAIVASHGKRPSRGNGKIATVDGQPKRAVGISSSSSHMRRSYRSVSILSAKYLALW